MKKQIMTLVAALFCLSWVHTPFAHADTWTREADFGGAGRDDAVGFSIGNKGYVGTGRDSLTSYRDFWEYDPAANGWTQKADIESMRSSIGMGDQLFSEKLY